MNNWSARQYLKFEDERTRPACDLLAQVPLRQARRVVDLGCGPGNSTALLVERFSQAEVIGLDSSADMLRQARSRLPDRQFVEVDIARWTPDAATDLLFANAVLHWVPDHRAVLRRLLETLPQGGVLAVQMPDNTREPALVVQREVAESEPWRDNPALRTAVRGGLPSPEVYYDLLGPLCPYIDIWHSIYNHVMAGPQAIVEWFKGSLLHRSCRRSTPSRKTDSSRPTPRRSRAPTSRGRTARCCCGFRGSLLWRCDNRSVPASCAARSIPA